MIGIDLVRLLASQGDSIFSKNVRGNWHLVLVSRIRIFAKLFTICVKMTG